MNYGWVLNFIIILTTTNGNNTNDTVDEEKSCISSVEWNTFSNYQPSLSIYLCPIVQGSVILKDLVLLDDDHLGGEKDFTSLVNVSIIKGNLHVENTTLPDLKFISSLKIVEGNVSFINNSRLARYDSLLNISIHGFVHLHQKSSECFSLIFQQHLMQIPRINLYPICPQYRGSLIVDDTKKIPDGLVVIRNNLTIRSVKDSFSVLDNLHQITDIGGSLIIENTNLTSINFLPNLKMITGDVLLLNNINLKSIDELLNFHRFEHFPHGIYIRGSNDFCDKSIQLNVLNERKSEFEGMIIAAFDPSCSTCLGGIISDDYLSSFDNRCKLIVGNLYIRDEKLIPLIQQKLNQIKRHEGKLYIGDDKIARDIHYILPKEGADEHLDSNNTQWVKIERIEIIESSMISSEHRMISSSSMTTINQFIQLSINIILIYITTLSNRDQ